MSNTGFRGVAGYCPRGARQSLAVPLLVLDAVAFLFTCSISLAQDSAVPAPSSGTAIVCIYRTYRFTGSSAHDELYVNGTHLAKLLNSEYAFMEVPPGTVVISGLPKEYYGSVIMSAAAAANQARQKENERARFEAEPGKTYYFKWTSGPFATGIKLEPVDSGKGAKDIRKLQARGRLGRTETRNERGPTGKLTSLRCVSFLVKDLLGWHSTSAWLGRPPQAQSCLFPA